MYRVGATLAVALTPTTDKAQRIVSCRGDPCGRPDNGTGSTTPVPPIRDCQGDRKGRPYHTQCSVMRYIYGMRCVSCRDDPCGRPDNGYRPTTPVPPISDCQGDRKGRPYRIQCEVMRYIYGMRCV